MRQKGQTESQLRGSSSSHPCKLILQALEKQPEQEHSYYNSLSAAQSSQILPKDKKCQESMSQVLHDSWWRLQEASFTSYFW